MKTYEIASILFHACAITVFALSSFLGAEELVQCAIFSEIIAIYFNTKRI